MNAEQFWEDIKNINEFISDTPVLVGVVANPQIKAAIRKELPNMTGGRRSSYNPIPIYDFEDVPTDKSVCFYDREKLNKYLEERNDGKDHFMALGAAMTDDVDLNSLPSLIDGLD